MPRQQGEVSGPPEGVALFVNTVKFDVIGTKGIRFSEHGQHLRQYAHTGTAFKCTHTYTHVHRGVHTHAHTYVHTRASSCIQGCQPCC